jgi:hypothetical protein
LSSLLVGSPVLGSRESAWFSGSWNEKASLRLPSMRPRLHLSSIKRRIEV